MFDCTRLDRIENAIQKHLVAQFPGIRMAIHYDPALCVAVVWCSGGDGECGHRTPLRDLEALTQREVEDHFVRVALNCARVAKDPLGLRTTQFAQVPNAKRAIALGGLA